MTKKKTTCFRILQNFICFERNCSSGIDFVNFYALQTILKAEKDADT